MNQESKLKLKGIMRELNQKNEQIHRSIEANQNSMRNELQSQLSSTYASPKAYLSPRTEPASHNNKIRSTHSSNNSQSNNKIGSNISHNNTNNKNNFDQNNTINNNAIPKSDSKRKFQSFGASNNPNFSSQDLHVAATQTGQQSSENNEMQQKLLNQLIPTFTSSHAHTQPSANHKWISAQLSRDEKSSTSTIGFGQRIPLGSNKSIESSDNQIYLNASHGVSSKAMKSMQLQQHQLKPRTEPSGSLFDSPPSRLLSESKSENQHQQQHQHSNYLSIHQTKNNNESQSKQSVQHKKQKQEFISIVSPREKSLQQYFSSSAADIFKIQQNTHNQISNTSSNNNLLRQKITKYSIQESVPSVNVVSGTLGSIARSLQDPSSDQQLLQLSGSMLTDQRMFDYCMFLENQYRRLERKVKRKNKEIELLRNEVKPETAQSIYDEISTMKFEENEDDSKWLIQFYNQPSRQQFNMHSPQSAFQSSRQDLNSAAAASAQTTEHKIQFESRNLILELEKRLKYSLDMQNRLKSALDQKKSECDAHLNSVSSLTLRVQELSDELLKEKRALQQSLQKSSTASINSKNNTATSQLESQVTSLKVDIDRLSIERTQILINCEQHCKKLNELHAHIAASAGREESLAEQVRGFQIELADKESEIYARIGEIEGLKVQLANTQHREIVEAEMKAKHDEQSKVALHNLEIATELRVLRAQSSAVIQSQVNEKYLILLKESEAQASRIAKYEETIENQKKQLADCSKLLEERKVKEDEWQARIEDASGKARESRRITEQITSERDRVIQEKQVNEEEIRKLKSNELEYQVNEKKLLLEIASLQLQIEQARESLQKVDANQSTVAQRKFEETLAENASLWKQEKLEMTQSFESRIKEMAAQIDEIVRAKHAQESELQRLMRESEAREKVVASLNGELQVVTQRNNQLASQFQSAFDEDKVKRANAQSQWRQSEEKYESTIHELREKLEKMITQTKDDAFTLRDVRFELDRTKELKAECADKLVKSKEKRGLLKLRLQELENQFSQVQIASTTKITLIEQELSKQVQEFNDKLAESRQKHKACEAELIKAKEQLQTQAKQLKKSSNEANSNTSLTASANQSASVNAAAQTAAIEKLNAQLRIVTSSLEEKEREIRSILSQENESRNKILTLQANQLDLTEKIEELKEESKAKQAKVSQRDATIKLLENELNAAREQAISIETQFKQIEDARNADLFGIQQSFHSQYNAQTNELDEVNQVLVQTQRALAETEEINAKLVREYDVLVCNFNSERETHAVEIDRMVQEYQARTQEYDFIKEEYEKIKELNEEKDNICQNIKAQLDSKENAIQEKEEAIKNHVKRFDGMKSQLEQVIADSKNEVRMLNEELTLQKSMATMNKTEADEALKIQFENTKKELISKLNVISDLTAEAKTLQDQILTQTEEKALLQQSYDDSVTKLTNALNSLKENQDSAQVQIHELTRQKEELQNENSEQIHQLKQEIHTKHLEIEQIQGELQKSLKRESEISSERQSIELKLSDCVSQCEQLSKQLAELQSQLLKSNDRSLEIESQLSDKIQSHQEELQLRDKAVQQQVEEQKRVLEQLSEQHQNELNALKFEHETQVKALADENESLIKNQKELSQRISELSQESKEQVRSMSEQNAKNALDMNDRLAQLLSEKSALEEKSAREIQGKCDTIVLLEDQLEQLRVLNSKSATQQANDFQELQMRFSGLSKELAMKSEELVNQSESQKVTEIHHSSAIGELSTRIDQLTSQLLNAQQTVKAQEVEIVECEKRHVKQIEELNVDLEAKQKSVNDLEVLIASLQEQLAGQNGRIEQISSELEEKKKQMEVNEKEKEVFILSEQEQKVELTRLKDVVVAGLELECAQLKEELKQVNEVVVLRISAVNENLSTELSSLRDSFATIQLTLSEQMKSCAIHVKEFEELQAKYQDEQSKNVVLDARVGELEKLVEELNQKLREAEEKMRELEESVQEYQSENASLEEKIMELDEQILNLEQNFKAQLNRESDAHKCAIIEVEEENKKKQFKLVSEFEVKYAKVVAESKEWADKFGLLQSTSVSADITNHYEQLLQNSQENARKLDEKYTAEKQHLEETIDALQAKLDSTTQLLTNLNNEREQDLVKQNQVAQEITSKNVKISSIESELQQLKSTNADLLKRSEELSQEVVALSLIKEEKELIDQENQQLKNQIDVAQKQVEQKSELENKQIEELKQKINEDVLEINRLTVLENQNAAKISKLIAENDENSKKLSEENENNLTELNAVRNENQELKNQIAKLTEDINENIAKLNQLSEELVQFKSREVDLVSEIKQLKESCSNYEGQLQQQIIQVNENDSDEGEEKVKRTTKKQKQSTPSDDQAVSAEPERKKESMVSESEKELLECLREQMEEQKNHYEKQFADFTRNEKRNAEYLSISEAQIKKLKEQIKLAAETEKAILAQSEAYGIQIDRIQAEKKQTESELHRMLVEQQERVRCLEGENANLERSLADMGQKLLTMQLQWGDKEEYDDQVLVANRNAAMIKSIILEFVRDFQTAIQNSDIFIKLSIDVPHIPDQLVLASQDLVQLLSESVQRFILYIQQAILLQQQKIADYEERLNLNVDSFCEKDLKDVQLMQNAGEHKQIELDLSAISNLESGLGGGTLGGGGGTASAAGAGIDGEFPIDFSNKNPQGQPMQSSFFTDGSDFEELQSIPGDFYNNNNNTRQQQQQSQSSQKPYQSNQINIYTPQKSQQQQQQQYSQQGSLVSYQQPSQNQLSQQLDKNVREEQENRISSLNTQLQQFMKLYENATIENEEMKRNLSHQKGSLANNSMLQQQLQDLSKTVKQNEEFQTQLEQLKEVIQDHEENEEMKNRIISELKNKLREAERELQENAASHIMQLVRKNFITFFKLGLDKNSKNLNMPVADEHLKILLNMLGIVDPEKKEFLASFQHIISNSKKFKLFS